MMMIIDNDNYLSKFVSDARKNNNLKKAPSIPPSRRSLPMSVPLDMGSPPPRLSVHDNKDIPPELRGAPTLELVRALGRFLILRGALLKEALFFSLLARL